MKKNKGLCWLVHHDTLIEYCYDYENRIKVIKEAKSSNEVPVRLYEMAFVKGKLPDEILKTSNKLQKAYANYKKTDNRWKKADVKWQSAVHKAKDEWQSAIHNHLSYLKKLHRKERPKTCWNGKKLVFRKSPYFKVSH